MNISEKTKTANREKLIETLYEITQSDKSEIKFKSINWDNDNSILLLKGLNETPDFTIFFGLDESDPARAYIFPDDEPECDMDFETTYTNTRKFTQKLLITSVKEILTACSIKS